MTEDRLFILARRLRPSLATLPPAQRLNAFGEMASLLFAAPLGLAALVWLILATPWSELRPAVLPLFLLAFTGYLFFLHSGDYWWEPGAESRLTFTITGWPLLVWTAALAWGTAALWLAVLWPLQHVRLTYRYRVVGERSSAWWRLALVMQSLAFVVLPGLTGLAAFDATGGVVPLSGEAPIAVGPALAAAMTLGWLPSLLALPLVNYLLRFVEAEETSGQLLRFLATGSGILAPGYLLASLGATLVADGGPTVLLLLAFALWLVTYVIYRLNRAAAHDRRQVTTLTMLEQLAQELLHAPVEDPDLPAILGRHIPAIFGLAWLEIRLFPDDVLYRQGQNWPTVDENVWQRLRNTSAPFLLLPMAARSPEGGGPLNAIVVPIGSADGEEVIGGVYLVMHRHLGEASTWLPALQSIAAQIASMVVRAESHKRMLEVQAELYQQEVFVQSYKAEALAERLAYQSVLGELQLAGQIQASLLPPFAPEVPGWGITVSLEPARDASGDFYDFIPLSDGRIGLLMADVAGKGIGAAIYMAVSKTLIRTYATEYELEPARAFQAANARMLVDTNGDWFVTVFYGVLDPAAGTLTYCNAGHNPPRMWLDGKHTAPERLTRTGIPLGLLDDQTWVQESIALPAGATLVLYTDGVTEAHNEFDELFGEDRLRMTIQESLDLPPEIIEFNVFSAVEDFVGDAPQFDDIALMVLARE
jgi:serine phosphatase RsbU (regulator of sigma subunit)